MFKIFQKKEKKEEPTAEQKMNQIGAELENLNNLFLNQNQEMLMAYQKMAG